MLKGSILTLLILILATSAIAPATEAAEIPGCDNAERFPDCIPCWTQCLYAIMADAWTGGDGWDGGDDW